MISVRLLTQAVSRQLEPDDDEAPKARAMVARRSARSDPVIDQSPEERRRSAQAFWQGGVSD